MTQWQTIDLNCDLGEYDDLTQGENDAQIMPLISSCNIACGGHAGNQQVIERSIALAMAHAVKIGAHPSYPDRTHFGRKVMHLPANELRVVVREQIAVLIAAALDQGVHVAHVKPHGALYNQAALDLNLALLLAETIGSFEQNLLFYGLAHSAMGQAAEQVGVPFVAEGFADRAYTVNRTLQPRSEPGAVIASAEAMLQRVIKLLQTGQMTAVSGQSIELQIDTLCLHGDHKDAVQAAKTLHQGLLAAGYDIKAPVCSEHRHG